MENVVEAVETAEQVAEAWTWGEAVTIFILGIGTVFAVLILLWAILAVMKVVFAKKAVEAPVAAPAPKQNSLNANQSSRKMSTPKKVATSAPQDENELVALLNGAVAGYTGATNLRVKSYKKVK